MLSSSGTEIVISLSEGKVSNLMQTWMIDFYVESVIYLFGLHRFSILGFKGEC